MDDQRVEELRETVNAGIAALERDRVDEARILFGKALDLADDIEDTRTRRDELSVLSELLVNRFPDLALGAAEDSVELDRELGLDRLLPQDMIGVGNAQRFLKNTGEAEALYRQALAILLERGDLANAASANTNLATMVAERNEFAEAIAICETSLEYLAKQPFDNTEMQTRFTLLQLYEFEEASVDKALDNARVLFDRLFDELTPMHLDAGSEMVEKCCARYLASHPEIEDVPAWKAATLPRLYGR